MQAARHGVGTPGDHQQGPPKIHGRVGGTKSRTASTRQSRRQRPTTRRASCLRGRERKGQIDPYSV
eukprot:15285896-Heterocapsa_arctica.AAC.1